MRSPRVIVVGAGIGGLTAAAELAARGFAVTVCEAANTVGGKIRQVTFDGHAGLDSGPTVFTMRWIFDDLFDALGTELDRHLKLTPLELLARHYWDGNGLEQAPLDLFASEDRTVDAISSFASRADGENYRAFARAARQTFDTLDTTFMRAARPNVAQLVLRIARERPSQVTSIHPFRTLWSQLIRHFEDPRLQQMFGRYATYCGSSPYLSPATLMLIAHAESRGVWLVEGGMKRLVDALADLARATGAEIRTNSPVATITARHGSVHGVTLADGERFEADAVIFNGDANALASGQLGEDCRDPKLAIHPAERSQSAITWSMIARPTGAQLAPHTVFFSQDYRSEFEATFFEQRAPAQPTVYIHAPDRPADGSSHASGAGHAPERIFALINAPADGDTRAWDGQRREAATRATMALLSRTGLELDVRDGQCVQTAPEDFEQLFPATGGALYGRASHGWQASFRRPGSRTRIKGLYLAGGSVHPGAGVPMAAMSGRLAAGAVFEDLTENSRVRRFSAGSVNATAPSKAPTEAAAAKSD